MTVSYNLDVSSIKSLAFLRLIFRWKGSIWKSVYFEVVSWLFFYYSVLVFYRVWLDKESQKVFIYFAAEYDKRLEWIPLTFMLGFFVSIVISRWQSIFSHIGFIDDVALIVSTYMPGADERARMMRRNVLRYLCLAQVLVLRDVAVPVKKRFPSLESILEAGYLNAEEKIMLSKVEHKFSKYYIPISWIFAILQDERRKDKIKTDLFLNVILQEVRTFRNNLQSLINYDWVPVPLAYPQVVYLAVRVYFTVCIFSRQNLQQEPDFVKGSVLYLVETFVPIMTVLQQLFYFGWLKVAEVLLNPLGEDDEDLETNFIIDRNRSIAMSVVDSNYGIFPTQHDDPFTNTQMKQSEFSNYNTSALVGSASLLVFEPPTADDPNPHQRKTSFGAKFKEQIQRRWSRSVSVRSDAPNNNPKQSWTGSHQSRKPTIIVREVPNLPTIQSLDETLEHHIKDENALTNLEHDVSNYKKFSSPN